MVKGALVKVPLKKNECGDLVNRILVNVNRERPSARDGMDSWVCEVTEA